MGTNTGHADSPACRCPFCRALEAYRRSEASKHVSAIGRETLQLARCLVNGVIQKAQDCLSSTPKP